MNTVNWYPHALASVSEGWCPEHRILLTWCSARDGNGILREDGWCNRCHAWWWLDYSDLTSGDDRPNVVTTWPWPIP